MHNSMTALCMHVLLEYYGKEWSSSVYRIGGSHNLNWWQVNFMYSGFKQLRALQGTILGVKIFCPWMKYYDNLQTIWDLHTWQ